MNLVVFPSKRPSRRQVADIEQIEYMIWKQNEDDENLLHIRAFNNRRPISSEDNPDSNPYPWRLVPLAYAHGISIAFYRYEILKIATNDQEIDGGNRDHIAIASLNLHYLDMVLDRLWINANAVVEADEMNSNWRCDVFNRWLRAEYYIHKHSRNEITDWEAKNPGIAWDDISIDALDWDVYEQQVPDWFHGKDWFPRLSAIKTDRSCLMTARHIARYLHGGVDFDEIVQPVANLKEKGKKRVEKPGADQDDMEIDSAEKVDVEKINPIRKGKRVRHKYIEMIKETHLTRKMRIKEPKKKQRAKKAKVTPSEVEDTKARSVGNDMETTAFERKDESSTGQSEQPVAPSNNNLVTDQSGSGTAIAISTSTSDNAIKRSTHDIDMEDPVAETITRGTSSQTAGIGTRVTRHSKRFKPDTDLIGGPTINNLDQTNFIMKLFEIKGASNTDNPPTLRIVKSSRVTPTVGTSTRSGSVVESSGQSMNEVLAPEASDEGESED